jgi:hypothetical protein
MRHAVSSRHVNKVLVHTFFLYKVPLVGVLGVALRNVCGAVGGAKVNQRKCHLLGVRTMEGRGRLENKKH